MSASKRTCSIEGCERAVAGRGWCKTHWQRYYRAGLLGPLPSLEERFWEKVYLAGPLSEHAPELGPCWLWTAHRNTSGYGKDGGVLAHRRAWQLTNGAVPIGLNVLHRCDCRPCVRPEHLFLGTQADNVADCMAKDRHFAKLTRAQVAELRRRHPSETQRALAAEFGVSPATVYRAVRWQAWL